MLGIILAAFAVGLSNFAASIAIGLQGVDAKMRLRVGLVFGLFEGIMPVIGLALGKAVANDLGGSSRWIGGGLLIATGLWGLVQSRRATAKGHDTAMGLGALILSGVALSIDNLVVGFALGGQSVPIWAAAVIIAVISVGLSLLGLELGSRLGPRVERWSGEIGAGVLILVGIAVAAGVL